MPELPEVEVVRRGLQGPLAGLGLRRVERLRADLRYPLPDMDGALAGRRLAAVRRRAKYLLFDFGETWLAWHLGMTGQFHVLPAAAPAGPHEHVRLLFEGGVSLRYRDARRFGYAGILPARGWTEHPWFAGLGPEPLEPGFSPATLERAFATRRAPVKQALMDARVVVGVGNIYACEALFRARIHPARPACRISRARIGRLHAAVVAVLSEAIEAGGSSISDFLRADGRPGYFAHAFRVYGRAGAPCVDCGRPIRRIVQGGRSTFYCPHCQR